MRHDPGSGPGFTEEVYEKALCIELGLRGIPFERQRSIAVGYKGHDLGAGRLDLLVDGCLVLELESVSALTQGRRGEGALLPQGERV